MSGHFIPGPTVEIHRYRAGEKWCFGCRKRLPHEDVLYDYPEDSPFAGYYEPIWSCYCSACGEDRTMFPGR